MGAVKRSSLYVWRPLVLDAVVQPPGSKSLSNRALLAAALASGRSRLTGVLVADDTYSMKACLGDLGVRISEDGPTSLVVEGRAGVFAVPPRNALSVGAAGTVARFVTAVLAAVPPPGTQPLRVDGASQMRERPMGQLLDALRTLGADFRCLGADGHLPIELAVGTRLCGGEVTFERPASSQFVSALAFGSSLASAPTRIHLREGTPSRPYVDMTLEVLERFGGSARWESHDVLVIEPRSLTACGEYSVEPDASGASYFLAMAAVHGGRVRVPGLGRASAQGDAAFCRVLERMGAHVEQNETSTAVSAGDLVGTDLDLTEMPDMALTAAVVALFAAGPTTIRGVEILRHHESDRLAAAATELRKLGAAVEELPDGLRIDPPSAGPRPGVAIDTYDDHRMAMAFALAGDVEIRDPGCVAKTFPSYFDELARLGMVAGSRAKTIG